MSAMIEAEMTVKDQDALIAALCEMGFAREQIEVHETPVHLYGYEGDRRADTAHVVIRRQHVGNASNDVGFLHQPNGFKAIVSNYDSRQNNHGRWCGLLDSRFKCGGGFVAELQARATICKAEINARRRGLNVRRVQEGRTVILTTER